VVVGILVPLWTVDPFEEPAILPLERRLVLGAGLVALFSGAALVDFGGGGPRGPGDGFFEIEGRNGVFFGHVGAPHFGVIVGEGMKAQVAVKVGVGGVPVMLGVRVRVAVNVRVAVRVGVAVLVGVFVRVLANVTVAVATFTNGVMVGVPVCVAVGGVPVTVEVAVAEGVGVFDAVGVALAVGVGEWGLMVTVGEAWKKRGVFVGVAVWAVANVESANPTVAAKRDFIEDLQREKVRTWTDPGRVNRARRHASRPSPARLRRPPG
jgi:hypothetical protein